MSCLIWDQTFFYTLIVFLEEYLKKKLILKDYKNVKQFGTRSERTLCPDLSPNYLQRSSADAKVAASMERANKTVTCMFIKLKYGVNIL